MVAAAWSEAEVGRKARKVPSGLPALENANKRENIMNGSEITFTDIHILYYELLKESFSERSYCTSWV